jgi:hypothetical protein
MNLLHSSLKGNVSTYCLNTEQISDLINRIVMPPPSSILASTIGVMFVGLKNLPQRTMPSFLQVNHACVHITLEQLKENNPLYSAIQISEQ